MDNSEPSPLYHGIKGCTSCSAHAKCKGPVPGEGPSSKVKVMLIGEAPGRNEDDSGRPFIGQAGQVLNDLLEPLSVNREDIYVTNAVKCRPPGNADPPPDVIQACTSRWLNTEIAMCQPEIIVVMGRIPMSAFQVQGTVAHTHGLPISWPDYTVLPVYHPAAALHQTHLLRQLEEDFAVLGKLVDGVAVADLQVKDAYPNPDYQESRPQDKYRYPVTAAIDSETEDGKLWSAQTSIKPGSAVFHKTDNYMFEADVVAHNYLYDARYISLPKGTIDTMVGAYLCGWPQGLKALALRKCGMQMQDYADLVLSHGNDKALPYLTEAAWRKWPDPPRAYDEKWSPKTGKREEISKQPDNIRKKIHNRLDSWQAENDFNLYEAWYDIPQAEREMVEVRLGKLAGATIADVPHDDAVRYACRDADATIRIWPIIQAELGRLGLTEVFYSQDLAIMPVLLSMMLNGMNINLQLLQTISSECSYNMQSALYDIGQIVGYSFNPGSGPQVAQCLYEHLKYPVTKLTPIAQAPSTDDRELKKIDHPVIKPILAYRGNLKLKGTYADGLQRHITLHQRIHTTLRNTVARTGRLSSAEPNLQNIPVRTALGKKIREAFVACQATDPNSADWVLLAADYSQIEMRVGAYVAGITNMMKLFQEGRDIHTETAALIYGISLEEAAKPVYRYPIKRGGFGVLYWISAEGLMMTFMEEGIEGWGRKDCESFIKDYLKLYPELEDYRRATIAYGIEHGYVRDMHGRIEYKPELRSNVKSIKSAGQREAANMPIQAGAGGILKAAMVELDRTCIDAATIQWQLQVHDELIWLIPRSWIDYVVGWCVPIMENVVSLGDVPVKVEVKVGDTWGTMAELRMAA